MKRRIDIDYAKEPKINDIDERRDVSSTVPSTLALMADRGNFFFFKYIVDKRDTAESLVSVKFSIYLHANHEDRTRDLLTNVSSLKHKIY